MRLEVIVSYDKVTHMIDHNNIPLSENPVKLQAHDHHKHMTITTYHSMVKQFAAVI